MEKIKGIDKRSLFRFRQFYLYYPQIANLLKSTQDTNNQEIIIVGSLTPLLGNGIVGSLTPLLNGDILTDPEKLVKTLSYTHIEQLLRIDDQHKRTYYERECIRSIWSVRELKRQINSLSYERSAAAKDPSSLRNKLSKSISQVRKEDLIKTPYIFDFLNLPDGVLGSETELDSALITGLKDFILELGHGFCFEAKQKRIVIGGEYFFIDLVFYHRILKCHILIELKLEEFNHVNVGQLNTYMNYYKENEQQKDDNPPIGILLCTHQNHELVRYAFGGMDENLFVSQYQTALPSTAQLEQFLKEERSKL